MTRRRRRNFKNEIFYHIRVEDWNVHVSFNDYAYINLFDQEPFAENAYITLSGYVESTMSKKVKEGHRALVILHESEGWNTWGRDDPDLTIGDMERMKDPAGGNERIIYFRVSIPLKSHRMIRSYLSHKVCGSVNLVGADLYRNRGKLFNLAFDSCRTSSETNECE
jgi:hypothetical protein